MKSVTAFVASAVLISALSVGPALAAGHDTPGDPAEANCHGQTMAYLAEAFGVTGVHGIGNIAKAAGLSVKEVQGIVDAYCATA